VCIDLAIPAGAPTAVHARSRDGKIDPAIACPQRQRVDNKDIKPSAEDSRKTYGVSVA
jgi:hypothetical protein